MIKRFFTLVPERILYSQFWLEVRNRNRWLILLRYGAVLLFAMLITAIYLLQSVIPEFHVNTFPLWVIAGAILLYNIGFDSLWLMLPNMNYGEKKFHSLHFSLLQIILDLVAVLLIIYYTGGVESPLYALLIFNVVFAAFFLPGRIVIFLVTIAFMASVGGALLEMYEYIPHYRVEGAFSFTLYQNQNYLMIFFALFGIAIYMSIYIVNAIAKELYARERELTEAYHDYEISEENKARYARAIINAVKPIFDFLVNKLNNTGQPDSGGNAETEAQAAIANDLFRHIDMLSETALNKSEEDFDEISLEKIIAGEIRNIREFADKSGVKLKYTCKIDNKALHRASRVDLSQAFNLILDVCVRRSQKDTFIKVDLHETGEFFKFSFAYEDSNYRTRDESVNIYRDINTEKLKLANAKKLVIFNKGLYEFHSPENEKEIPTRVINIIFKKNLF